MPQTAIVCPFRPFATGPAGCRSPPAFWPPPCRVQAVHLSNVEIPDAFAAMLPDFFDV